MGISEQNRRFEDTAIGRLIRSWPIILSLAILIGSAYVVREDVTNVKATVKELAVLEADKEKRLIRVEEAVKSISEIKDEVKEMRRMMERVLRAR